MTTATDLALSGQQLEDVRWLARFLVVEAMDDMREPDMHTGRRPSEELAELLELVSAMTTLDLNADYPDGGPGSPRELPAKELEALLVTGQRFEDHLSGWIDNPELRELDSAECNAARRGIRERLRAGIAAIKGA